MTRPAVARLSRASLRANLSHAHALADGAFLYAVVKADAYGHGLISSAIVLADGGARAFAVACLEEAVMLREAGIQHPVLLLEGAVDQTELIEARARDLQLVVHCEEQIASLRALGESYPARLWLKCDSGMGRLGFAPGEIPDAWDRLRALGPLELGLMTHFATADDPSHPAGAEQCAVWRDVVRQTDARFTSARNSAALLTRLVDGDCPRAGLMLYGASPIINGSARQLGLAPVTTFESRLIAARELPVGAAVGYGQAWVAQRPTRLGIVAAGYGDGYPRHAPDGTPTLVRGRRAPLIGRVSMDMLAVDLTDVPGSQRGDRVELWGAGLPIEEVARAADTIPYTLMCGLTPRVRRVWED
ncbi:MAG: alanine racemase [Pseudomonadota bacterium]